MTRPQTRPAPRYLAIVAEVRARIADRSLRPGDAAPSTREIMRRWKVAMATATRVVTVLRDEGLLHVRPGVGTVVAGGPGRDGRTPPGVATERRRGGDEAASALRARLVQVAIAVADAEGLPAVTLRRIAAELGTPTMSLYGHVEGKDALVDRMLDAALARRPLPATRPDGWRAQLELTARAQWAAYREHPWLAQAMSLSFTRPLASPHAMAHTEWALAAIDGLGLDPTAQLHAAVTLAGYVHGTALKLLSEIDARHETGVTGDEWMQSRHDELASAIGSGAFPTLSRLTSGPDLEMSLEALFEFGLQRLLDGFAAYFAGRTPSKHARVARPHGSR